MDRDGAAPGRRAGGVWFLGGGGVHISADETRLTYCLLEVAAPSRDQTPLHVHHDDDEGFYLLEGRLRLYVGRESFLLEPGESALAPRGIPHTWRVESEQGARWLNVSGPAFERFCLAADQAPGRSMAEVAAEHGIDIIGPPGTLPDGWPSGSDATA
jgi:mannose-6-phosphate isomerase-like protein (cupin superfamily)